MQIGLHRLYRCRLRHNGLERCADHMIIAWRGDEVVFISERFSRSEVSLITIRYKFDHIDCVVVDCSVVDRNEAHATQSSHRDPVKLIFISEYASRSEISFTPVRCVFKYISCIVVDCSVVPRSEAHAAKLSHRHLVKLVSIFR